MKEQKYVFFCKWLVNPDGNEKEKCQGTSDAIKYSEVKDNGLFYAMKAIETSGSPITGGMIKEAYEETILRLKSGTSALYENYKDLSYGNVWFMVSLHCQNDWTLILSKIYHLMFVAYFFSFRLANCLLSYH